MVARRTTSERFIGRVEDLDTLRGLLAAAAGGHPQLVMVEGDAGIGKTRLVGELVGEAARGDARALIGHCVQFLDRAPALAPVVGALRQLVDDGPPALVERILDPWRHTLARLLPGPDTVAIPERVAASVPAAPASTDPILDADRLFDALLGLFGSLAARQPTVIVFEDVHWADRSTLDLLEYLGRNLTTEPLLIVVTLRADAVDRGHPLLSLVAELDRLPRVTRLVLSGLDDGEVAELASELLDGRAPDDELLDAVRRRSEGNPFFAEELIAAHPGAGAALPASLRGFLASRLSRVSHGAMTVLKAAAVAGRVVHHELLAAVAAGDDLSEAELHRALREVTDLGILRVERGSPVYTFRHALLQEAVDEELLPFEHSGLHRRVAETLVARPELCAEGPGALAAELAAHWTGAGDLPRALGAAFDAARAELAFGARSEAIEHFEMAVGLWDRVPDARELAGCDLVDGLVETADVCESQAEFARAEGHLRRAVALVDAVSSPVRSGFLRAKLGRCTWYGGAAGDGMTELTAGLALIPAEPPSAERFHALAWKAQLLLIESRFDDAEALAEESLAVARLVGVVAETADVLCTLGTALGLKGELGRAEPMLAEARVSAIRAGDFEAAVRAVRNQGAILAVNGQFAEALRTGVDGLALVEQAGLGRSSIRSMVVGIAALAVDAGNLERADQLLNRVRDWDAPGLDGVTLHLTEAQLALWRGELGEAQIECGLARSIGSSYDDPQTTAWVNIIEAAIARWQGSLEVAAEAIARAWEIVQRASDRFYVCLVALEGARIEAEQVTVAHRVGTPSFERSGDWVLIMASGHALAPAFAMAIEAERTRFEQRPDPVIFESAQREFEGVGMVLEALVCGYRAAEAHLARGDRNRGAAALVEVHDRARRLGAGLITQETHALARRSRVELSEDVIDLRESAIPTIVVDTFGLSDRELEVLAILCDGLTNKQIAPLLFVSPKTVAAHVSSILAKLGVATRGEAAAMAHRLGLVGQFSAR